MARVVLLDVGGVLLMPSPEVVHQALALGGVRPSPDQLDRAHYEATAAADAEETYDRRVYQNAYVRSCGVAEQQVAETVNRFTEMFTGHDWMRVVAGGASGIRRLTAAGVSVGIVSNAVGTVRQMLDQAGVCQVGEGPLASVRVVVDSAVVGVAKPDPAIFRFALDALAVPASEAMYVGDTARLDVDSARNAGLRPVHFDPFGLCPDPAGDHDHVKTVGQVVELL